MLAFDQSIEKMRGSLRRNGKNVKEKGKGKQDKAKESLSKKTDESLLPQTLIHFLQSIYPGFFRVIYRYEVFTLVIT